MKTRSAIRMATVLAALAALTALVLPAAAFATTAPGGVLWTRYLTSSGTKSDQFKQLATGPGGVIYAVGDLHSSPNALVLAKFSSSGKLLWKRTTTGPAHHGATAAAVAVDAAGSVVVAGSAYASTATVTDILVAKYTASGVRLWQRAVNGSGGADDRAAGLVVDAAGNAYVTGYETGIGTGQDAVELKLNAADGTTAWSYGYRGPAASPGATADAAAAITMDSYGYTYLTGSSVDPATPSKRDAFVIRIDPAGVPAWVSRRASTGNYALGLDIAVNPTTSTSYASGYGFVPASFNSEMLLAATSFSGTPFYTSHVTLVTGANVGLAVTVDPNGAPIVAWMAMETGGLAHAVLSKYATTTDTTTWVRQFAPGGAASGFLDVTTDAANNVYVAGYSGSPFAKENVLVAKYAADGTLLWKRVVNGPAHKYDLAVALATSGSSVYVVGQATRAGSGGDAVVLKIRK